MNAQLEAYNRKRSFDRTPEPKGIESGSGSPTVDPSDRLRFGVQHHVARRDHYDLRLEWNGALLSWAVPKGPSFDPRDKRLAVHVENHPLEYRSFEGTIPKGEYGGGTVMLWDEGFWTPLGDVDESLRNGELKFKLYGQRLKGAWVLVKLRQKPGERGDNWLLIKERDEFAQSENAISPFTTSIETGRTMEEIAQEAAEHGERNPFKETPVQLAKLVTDVPTGRNWLYEVKYDGYRIVAYVEGGRTRLTTRNGLDYTDRFPDIAASLSRWSDGRAMVLDGELVVTDEDGRSDFQALQSFLRSPEGKRPAYIVFDLLALDGEDLRDQPLVERKRLLEELVHDAPLAVRFSAHVSEQGEESFRAACELGLEGIVGKRRDSRYRGRRTGDWIKLKCDRSQEFVVGGYTCTEKARAGVSALLLGTFENGVFEYAGRAGSGISADDAHELLERFRGLERCDPPFSNPPRARTGECLTWLKPELVVQVRFSEWTEDGQLRHPSYQGLRADKEPRDVHREDAAGAPRPSAASNDTDDTTRRAAKQSEPASRIASPERNASSTNRTEHRMTTENTGAAHALAESSDSKNGLERASDPPSSKRRAAEPGERSPRPKSPRGTAATDGLVVDGVRITSPDKLLFTDPDVTKADVVRYYAQAAEALLPYASGRILSIVRCPRGIESACFFKKHPGPGAAGVVTVTVPSSDGTPEEYFYVDDVRGIVTEAQMDTLEFHVWGSRVETLEQPDMMVFDLDPDEGLGLEQIRQGVRDLKGMLDELSLTSFLKTSGGKGYHVVVPFEPSASWEAFHSFARRIADVMAQRWPDRYTNNIRKAKRKGRIFIDWQRNGRGATSIAPYSLRARHGARVSTPLSWDELGHVAPDAVTMADALERIGSHSDPWKGFFDVEQALKQS
ncbi:non-homologous end-joining DNA ligase [Enteroscipio rubneri]|nr:non-homologous end-joining DNA ligase [Enteroscipio rubneri]